MKLGQHVACLTLTNMHLFRLMNLLLGHLLVGKCYKATTRKVTTVRCCPYNQVARHIMVHGYIVITELVT